jgi:SAM-dependent methyltransferase
VADHQRTLAMQDYFSGTRLYGDDFDEQGILEWYRDEEAGYFKLWGENRVAGFYDYHALNERHAFRYLPAGSLGKLLSFGGANGEEVRPVAARTSGVVIVEPATYDTRELGGVPVEYRRPVPVGPLPAVDSEFSLVTCFAALHHIPNVSWIVREFSRVLAPGGYALIREPVISMGDWRQPRRGLTPRERGIPLGVFDEILGQAGFDVVRRVRCVHPLTPRIAALLRINTFNSQAMVYLDSILSALHVVSGRYHAEYWWQKLRPASVAYVLRKR